MLKLRNAVREYEDDRWRIISTNVGNGFSPAACKEKVVEMTQEGEDLAAVEEDEEEEDVEQVVPEPLGPAMVEGPQPHLYQ